MQTELADFIRDTPEGREADAILRKCVHCGFCTATCPTYQLLGDELDSPRGRIYLMKQVLEGAPVTAKTQLHLDRCLTCRACETTCPSGVRYGRLVDIGRAVVEARTRRAPWDRLQRALLAFGLPRTALFGGGACASAPAGSAMAPRSAAGRSVARAAPRAQDAGARAAACSRRSRRRSTPPRRACSTASASRCSRCPAPAAAARVRFHLNDQEGGRDDMRAHIDAWWPLVERGEVEAIVMTASGCGVTVKEYGHLLAHDPATRQGGARSPRSTRDLCEVIRPEDLPAGGKRGRVAFHSPCTLQHGQQMRGRVEALLDALGYELAPVRDAHLCCGSAGTYSLLQPAIAGELRERKLAALQEGAPEAIATANIGCLTHLQAPTATPVRHWIELLDEALA